MELRRRWAMNSIRLIIFTVRAEARCFGVDDGSQRAGLDTGSQQRADRLNTACCASYVMSSRRRVDGQVTLHSLPLLLRHVIAFSALLPDFSLSRCSSPALLFVFRVRLFFYI